jgi:hypothetical protein
MNWFLTQICIRHCEECKRRSNLIPNAIPVPVFTRINSAGRELCTTIASIVDSWTTEGSCPTFLDHPVKPDDDRKMYEIAAPSLQDGSQ